MSLNYTISFSLSVNNDGPRLHSGLCMFNCVLETFRESSTASGEAIGRARPSKHSGRVDSTEAGPVAQLVRAHP